MTSLENPKGDRLGYYPVQVPRFDLENDMILTPSTKQALEECIVLLRFHETIYREWGFDEVDELGQSAVLNFYGPPGTGKTMAAEALAGSLHMGILILNCSDLESSLKGQMSKNIQSAFQTAYQEDALLFFDEADSLLGRRIAVSQGVDNDINATRSTFMTELNHYEGITIFATNFPRDYDQAILSRITHQIYFELPDIPTRRGLWRRFFVERIPLAIDREDLVDHAVEISDGLAGRDILQAVRRALPMVLQEAADTGEKPALNVDHVSRAVKAVKLRYRNIGSAAKREESDPEASGSLRRPIKHK